MAFTPVLVGRINLGSRTMTHGTYVSAGGSTGGDIDTGLDWCENLILTSKGSSVVADDATLNENLPIAGSAVTIVTTANASGYWMAIGR